MFRSLGIGGCPQVFINGKDVIQEPLEAGSVICFTRGQLHTFSAPRTEMHMLSLHYPFIELDDEEQWTLPKSGYVPRGGVAS